MNGAVIEATPQLKIPRPILRSRISPARHRVREHDPPLPAETPSCQHFRPVFTSPASPISL
jgi:hypothetical protein